MQHPINQRDFLRLSAETTRALHYGERPDPSAPQATSATTQIYDDCSGKTPYSSLWSPYNIPDPNTLPPTYAHGQLQLSCNPFHLSQHDNVDDHMKYMGRSTQAFPIPSNGSVMFSADLSAQTPGTDVGHLIQTTGRRLLEGQQAACTIHLINFETGQLYDWFVSGTRAFPLYERLFVTQPPELPLGFTQIPGAPNTNNGLAESFAATSSQDFTITPGPHNYAIIYNRSLSASAIDYVQYLIDGEVVAWVDNSGIPLDVQNAYYANSSNPITYRSVGPGASVADQMSTFVICHGLFSLLDEWPFNQFPNYNSVSIPAEQRAWGQGAIGHFESFKVTTVNF